MSDLMPKGFSNGKYVERNLLRDKLYEEDAITMGGVAILNNFPAADVVKVVRCRDCFYNRGETKDLWGNPAIKCVTAVTHEPDWYCASGKRKD